MLSKALNYCLQEGEPISFTELMDNVYCKKREKPKLINSFVTPSTLRQIIEDQQKRGRSTSDFRVRTKVIALKAESQTFQNKELRKVVKQNNFDNRCNRSLIEQQKTIQAKILFDKKHQIYRKKVEKNYHNLEDIF